MLTGISLDMHAGEFVAVLGPNGAGKSTLLRAMAGQETLSAGEVYLGEQNVGAIPRRSLARQVAFVEATLDLAFGVSVEGIVMMGRAPHAEGWYEAAEDLAKVQAALQAMDLGHLAQRDFRTLSNGEKQRAILASALAQEPCVLLLDEPAAFLDWAHQRDLFARLRGLAAEGMLVVTVTHDWNLAAAWSSRVVLLKQGRVVAEGAPGDMVRHGYLEKVFGTPIEVHWSACGTPFIHLPGIAATENPS